MIQLRDYQVKAVKKLVECTNNLLVLQAAKTIVFKSPTGSGKTIMMAEYLKDLVENRKDQKTFAFIWTAPRQLHEQSKNKLLSYFEDSKTLRCVSFEDLVDRKINQNDILFLNWESINKADNIFIRENELDFNLSTILDNTRDAGNSVILIIDESHFASKSEISRGLIDMFAPKVTIEVSATPNLQGDEKVTVYPEQVIAEGIIKKQIAINPGFKNEIVGGNGDNVTFKTQADESTDEFILRVALEKREQLAKDYAIARSNVNPLLLIQLPDKKEGESDVKDTVIEILKDHHNITLENGKLAVYLSEDKANLENITKNDAEVEVMIFKQAIALGWDCPRASILVLFRNFRSYIFSTQTLGRILRMPELKHYSNETLNIGYVFTNLGDLSILNDSAGTYLTIQYAQRKEAYKDIDLRSVYSKRFREETRLSPIFIKKFIMAARTMELEKKLDLDLREINIQLLTDGIVNNIDETTDHVADTSEIIQKIQNLVEVQKLFDNFVIDTLAPFFPETRSVGRVKEAIYRFFQLSYPMKFQYGDSKIHLIVLNSNNKQLFIDTLNLAKELYMQGIERGRREIITSSWNVPFLRTYGNQYISHHYSKSILQPYFEAQNSSIPEKDFAKFINETINDVEWFYKNGESDATAFAVPYNNGGVITPFYVDWIIKFSDGRIGLFDTKEGITAATAKSRAEGLAAYIKAENSLGKKLFGGIVIEINGSWRYNDCEVYSYDLNDLSQWKFL